MVAPSFAPAPLVARELQLPERGVAAVLDLLGGGATVPFIARYRKEATGDLDEVQIRAIEERCGYLRDLHERRATILESIASQGKLDDALRSRILAAPTKAALEDLYLPFRPKRRTRATMARERGLEPLAERILLQPRQGSPDAEARAFVSEEKGVPDGAAALAGARDIVAERISEDPEVRAMVRGATAEDGDLRSSVVPEKRGERTKFEQYYDFHEPLAAIPSHRFLALQRGESEGVLRVKIEVPREPLLRRVEGHMRLDRASPFAAPLAAAIDDALDRLVEPSVATDVLGELKSRADARAVEVFASNLRSLLLAAPLGARPVIGVDPGLRTGSKMVAVDATGKFIATRTLYLVQGNRAAENTAALLSFVREHAPAAIGVGNGTGGRETEAFIRGALAEGGISDVIVVPVNEAGASVYSASDVAREEFPDLDVTVRGAISIARRLQDPLAELVKIEPKSIGVGQYQHDVHQALLARKLDEVVESCVNHVGVEVNTASAPLLAHVAGIGKALAKKIVRHRETNGRFPGRAALLQVSGLGPRTFEQAAGFLRVHDGAHPLDRSAVHPERYSLVERMAKDLGVGLAALVGDAALAERIDLGRYAGDGVGAPTLRDIVAELKKPGRDPRDRFEPPQFRDDVHTLEDLAAGMAFEGLVTNVTAFGAFVDIGVHQDGLVHISQLANRFVRDPHEVVKPGDKLKVRVIEVDLSRRRISLTARTDAVPTKGAAAPQATGSPRGSERATPPAGRRAKGGEAPGEKGVNARSKLTHNPFAHLGKK